MIIFFSLLLWVERLRLVAEAPRPAIGRVHHNKPALAGVGGGARTDGRAQVGLAAGSILSAHANWLVIIR